MAMNPEELKNLTHYSHQRLKTIHSRPQPDKTSEGSYRSPYDKPKGLWVSNESDHGWKDWCVGEQWELRPNSFNWRNDILLKPDASVLILEDSVDVVRFSREWGKADHKYRDSIYIDWKGVASEWQGIIIPNYLWNDRLHHQWYYPWDCASGCIWDADAIKSITSWRLHGDYPIQSRYIRPERQDDCGVSK
ncbi:hypothetical protein UFOVP28_77 [uncultured Caudovirales phage]|uniref:Uncharacterized protein n=1 Tax=uncultured Caudovirales phage TaxID=2100421 RepID=A0A6J5KSC7_9CAUD|nr:hypothetical protein UFOVP28_77 [uncultured Caudovirales phage]